MKRYLMKTIFYTLFFSLFLIQTLNATDLRLSLNTFRDNPSAYKLLDTRSAKLYKVGHIPNAINFPIIETYENKAKNGKLTNPFSMQKIVQNLGLQASDALVIYDDGTFFDAARLFWALEVYGFKNVKLLSAGYQQWIDKDYKISTTVPSVSKSNYITIVDNDRLATKFSTLIATKNPNQIIIDARPDKAYIGKVSSAKRYGHIPKALNIPASHNIETSSHSKALKEVDELSKIYKDIPKNKKIIIYCAIGRISATNYFALRELGYNVSNYDASWKEWGNSTLPIIEPTKH